MNRVVDHGLENAFGKGKSDVVPFQKIASVKSADHVKDVVELAKISIEKNDVIEGKFTFLILHERSIY